MSIFSYRERPPNPAIILVSKLSSLKPKHSSFQQEITAIMVPKTHRMVRLDRLLPAHLLYDLLCSEPWSSFYVQRMEMHCPQ